MLTEVQNCFTEKTGTERAAQSFFESTKNAIDKRYNQYQGDFFNLTKAYDITKYEFLVTKRHPCGGILVARKV
jgi:hypothetical protein